jgi:large subunit ribosomal protein L22
MEAFLKNHRQSPRKVRLVANLVKGKKVAEAMTELNFVPKRASLPIKKLIASAAANAKTNFNLPVEGLIVKNLTVDKGVTMKRHRYVARGGVHKLDKHSSHIRVTLAPAPVPVTKAKTKKLAAKS